MSDIVGFEHLHRHTDFSLLDGYATVEEYAEYSERVNQKYLCISDHGAMGAIPRQIRACDEHNLKPIFACELYINPMQPNITDVSMTEFNRGLGSDEEKKRLRKSNHLLAIAYNEVGYGNLVALSSWGWTRGFYYKPRVNYEILQQHKEGIIFTSCCYNSEIGQAFDQGGEGPAMEMVEKYMAMFGDDFYLEIMLLDFKKQKPYDVFIIKASEKYGLPIIVTNDCHYCMQEDSDMQRKMIMIQTGKTMKGIQQALAQDEMADLFELQDASLWMKSEEEINDKWESDYKDVIDYEVLRQAKLNTVAVCKKAEGVKLDRSLKLPIFPGADEKFKAAIIEGVIKRRLPKNKEYLDRIEEEYGLICQKGFSSYFLIQKMMTDEARRWYGEQTGTSGSAAVGPGRGSAVGALVCYCLGITDVDPIKHDLLFSRFLSPARGGKQIKFRFSGEPRFSNVDPVPKEDVLEECPF